LLAVGASYKGRTSGVAGRAQQGRGGFCLNAMFLAVVTVFSVDAALS